ncbi:GGDEF domain-containing protein [Paraglaciecola sp.]|uniref:GGDEF domain-containing protein n=1 Tax=Paraglaciecola sp. TaxID=1920173 RepID=UPI003EFA50B0
MIKKTLDNLGKLKVLAFVITVGFVGFYDYLPKRTLELVPHAELLSQETTDKVVGGNSEFEWVNKETNHWACTFKNQYEYPYCNISITWSKRPFLKIDFSNYSHLEMDLDYQGDATYLRIFLRNYYRHSTEPDMLQSGKFNTVTMYSPIFKQKTAIYFNELRVSDWWIDDYNIPPSDVKPDVSAVVAMGIDIPHPAPLGRHTFQLKSLKAVGNYIEKEALYLSIILFWTALLLGEFLLKFIQLRNKSRNYGKKLSRMAEQSEIYKEKAETDKLTNILNREGLTQIIEKLNKQGLLPQYAVIVLDIDLFKKINDEFGHLTGDEVLKDLASIVHSCMRSYDIFARWGGEEFVILFHCLDDSHLMTFAEKIRIAIESATLIKDKKGYVTASLGVAKMGNPANFEETFKKADEAVYTAKSAGRNKSVVI